MNSQLESIQTKIKNLRALKLEGEHDLEKINILLEWELFYEAYSIGSNYIIDIKAFNEWLEENKETMPISTGTINDRLHFAYGIYLDEVGQ